MRMFLIGIFLTLFSEVSLADDVDKAIRIYSRITGTPPSPAILQQMTTLIANGEVKEAALLATEDPNFLKITIKNMVSPWTNEERETNVPLNDYTATIIGLIRDDLSFKSIFSDILYVGSSQLNLPPYANDNNQHYEALEDGNFDYSDPEVLVSGRQTTFTNFEIGVGILTSRGFSSAFYDGGTNRLPFAATMSTFLCREMEQLHDNTRSKAYIRQDLPRDPGGDTKLYLAKCSGCHAIMDAVTPAFAHNDFVEGVNIYDPATIPAKMTRNSYIFPEGKVVTTDDWVNLMTDGVNKDLGWTNAPASGLYEGKGLQAFGDMILSSEAFSKCMATRVYKQVCLRSLSDDSQMNDVTKLSQSFTASGFKMKNLFAETATLCTGE